MFKFNQKKINICLKRIFIIVKFVEYNIVSEAAEKL